MLLRASLIVASTLSTLLLFFTASSSAITCTRPSVRREWRQLTINERAQWIAAINCLSTLPHDDALAPSIDPSVSKIPPVNTSGSYWDDLVYVHMDLNIRIHGTGYFLPFHRLYVQAVETAIKERCGYTGGFPYWDWSIDAHDVENSPLFRESDPASGLGGWGDPARDIEVQDGGFRRFALSYPAPHTLRRNFTLQPFVAFGANPVFADPAVYANTSFTPDEVRKLVRWPAGDFVGFQAYMERPEGPHSSVHFIIGGDLSGYCPANAAPGCVNGQPTFSANEPMFFLHHAMVDKVWYDWQHAHPANSWAFRGGSVQNLTSVQALHDYPNGMPPALSLDSGIHADGMFPDLTVRDVMNTTGGYLCYVYE
ncbi:Di-copper centre-containing protein [Daedaleopsis nitida]|nr:Di-copper centre-containing protein [Daedaleopsis nitida]